MRNKWMTISTMASERGIRSTLASDRTRHERFVEELKCSGGHVPCRSGAVSGRHLYWNHVHVEKFRARPRLCAVDFAFASCRSLGGHFRSSIFTWNIARLKNSRSKRTPGNTAFSEPLLRRIKAIQPEYPNVIVLGTPNSNEKLFCTETIGEK